MYSELMSKVYLYATKKDIKKIIEILHREKVYHITKPEENKNATPLEMAEEVADALNKVESILSHLKNEIEEKKMDDFSHSSSPLKSDRLKAILKEVDEMHDEFSGLIREESAMKERLSEINEKLEQLEKFKDCPWFNMEELKSVKFAFLTADEKFEEGLRKKTDNYELWNNGNYYAVAYDVRVDLNDLFKPLTLFNFSMPLKQQYDDLMKERKEVEKSYHLTLSKLDKYRKMRGKIYDYRRILRSELEKLEAPLKFSHLGRSFYVSGYVPTDRVPHLKTILDKEIGDSYHLFEEIVPRREEAPVKLNNKSVVSPFEFFLNLYALPKYNEIDPTPLVFVTFPIIFGAMLGDIGYGLITLLIFLILRIKMKKFKGFFDILVWSSIWTVIFGMFFGEFFGAEEIALGTTVYHLPHVIARLHEINSMLVFSVIFGLVHVNLGLILGFFNIWKQHGFKEAVLEKISWIVIEIGVGIMAYEYVKKQSLLIGALVFVLGVIMLYKGEGMYGLIELPGIFGNILSYARIMAIGLASAGLAVVVNDFATKFFSSGTVGGIISAVLILLIGHAINILLGLIGPFLHSLRLHYVEEFTKFFKGGGKPYEPFGIER